MYESCFIPEGKSPAIFIENLILRVEVKNTQIIQQLHLQQTNDRFNPELQLIQLINKAH